MKSETFNGSRFWNYFKYDLVQMWRNHMKAALGISLAGLVLYVAVISWNLVFHQTWQAPGFDGRMIIAFLAFCALEFYQTRTYGYLTEKKAGSAWLMVPASGVEKWVSMLIMTLIIIPVLFCVVYLGVDWLLCLVDHTSGASLLSSFYDGVSKLGTIEAADLPFSIGSLIWLMIAGFCFNFLYWLLCGICFKRFKIIWGIAIAFAGSLLISIIGGSALALNEDSLELMAQESVDATTGFMWLSGILTAAAVCLAGGILYRIKTIKH